MTTTMIKIRKHNDWWRVTWPDGCVHTFRTYTLALAVANHREMRRAHWYEF